MPWFFMTKRKIRRIKQIMKLAQLFSDFEEELIRQGEEAESLSFVYRSLKNLSLRTLFCPPAGSD